MSARNEYIFLLGMLEVSPIACVPPHGFLTVPSMYTPTLDTASLSDFHITSHCVGLFALPLISTQRQTLRDELVRFSNDRPVL